ncbi:hypothetical protein CONCODRAFT_8088, partial [Conidiobolus coronatus NRRL 28638]
NNNGSGGNNGNSGSGGNGGDGDGEDDGGNGGNNDQVAKKSKARTILVKLLSSANTGYFYVRSRPRLADKLSFMKFDPRVNKHVLFTEHKLK